MVEEMGLLCFWVNYLTLSSCWVWVNLSRLSSTMAHKNGLTSSVQPNHISLQSGPVWFVCFLVFFFNRWFVFWFVWIKLNYMICLLIIFNTFIWKIRWKFWKILRQLLRINYHIYIYMDSRKEKNCE